jgi:ATP-binding cassette subfamily B protein
MNSVLRRYAKLCRGYELPLLLFLCLAILQFLTIAPVPFVVQRVFDSALGDRRLALLIGLAVLVLVLQALSSVFGLLSANWILRVSTEVVRNLRRSVFDKLYSLSINYHETNRIGDIHDRVVHETERVDLMTRGGYAIAIPALVFTIGIMGVLVFINWALFLITLGFVPIVYAINRLSTNVLRRTSRRLHASVEAFSEAAFASLRTMRQTRILGAESRSRVEHEVVLERAAMAAKDQGMTRRAHQDANRLAVSLWVVAILVVGGAGVIDGRLTIGELFAFYAGLALIRQPLDQMVASVPIIVAGHAALDRVFELLDVDDPRPYSGVRQLDVRGHLVVDHVTFEYEPGLPVLCDVNLDVRPGEVLALIGSNGAGKTTLLNLIVGFYRPNSGTISLDAVGYDELDMPYVRRQLGVLTQDPVMVPGTIAENITYGRPDLTEADIALAVDLAAAGPMIAGLDAGLETRAYESGPLLSGGQLQRVALARALLGNPRMLILDEPSNHLDVEGIAGVLHGLRSFVQPPAMIIITHDPAVAAMADRTLRLTNGVLTPV